MIDIQRFITDNIISRKRVTSNKGYIKSKYPVEYNYIMKSTEFLNMVQPSFAQRIYHIYNNIYVLQKCPTCNNTLKFLGFSKGYRKYCTKACIDWKEHYKNISKSVYEKYGVYNISSAEFIKNKKQETCRSHYGVDYPVQCEKVKNKTIETNIKKYGTNWVFQSESFKIKSNNTNLIRYGNECNSKSDICKETYQNNRLDKLKSNWHQIVEDFESFGYKLVSTPENYRWNTIELICPKGHHHITSKSNWNRGVRCGKCANNSTSNAEREVGDFLKNYKIDIIENNRNIIPPYELDIFMLSHNIAIEYNGLYWHKFKNDDYHITKTDLCNSKGIQLIHIFEDEWLYKRDIVKSMILSKLGIYGQRIGARECKIIVVDNRDKELFLNNNHIQGNCISSINIGLYYENELVSIMTFGKRKITGNVSCEMLRYCSKLNTQVVGGAKRIFKYFTDKYYIEPIISYTDRRWSNGGIYRQLGFNSIRLTTPNYYYVSVGSKTRENRIQYQKHKLIDKLKTYDSKLTEWQNMQNNGYNRIWDCGQIVWRFEK